MNPASPRVGSQGGSAAGTAGRRATARRRTSGKRIAPSLGHRPPRHGNAGRRAKSAKAATGRLRIAKSAAKSISKRSLHGRRLAAGELKIGSPPKTTPCFIRRPFRRGQNSPTRWLCPVQQDAFADSPPSDEIRLVWGRSGDHAAVYHMLLAVFQAPSRDEFQAQTEDPFYEPTDRLLVKRGFRVLSHLHLTHRTMYFGSVAFPVAGFHGLGTLPEFRGQGFATRLLHEGERRIAGEGAALGLVRTRIPKFFRRAGWAVCGRHCFSQAKAREVLGRLHGEHSALLARPLSIRRWRHVEMPALVRLYQQNSQHAYGSFERTDAYWRWLVGRQAYDSLLVALDGPDKLELEETTAPIVGFGVLRQEQLVELCTVPGHPTADYQLLARACGDAIEHDRQDIILTPRPAIHCMKWFLPRGGIITTTRPITTKCSWSKSSIR